MGSRMSAPLESMVRTVGRRASCRRGGRDFPLSNQPEKMAKISFRKHDWYDGIANKPMFGIQGKATGFEARWAHCAADGKPLVFHTEAERDAELKRLRKRARA